MLAALKRSEEALRRSEESFDVAFRLSPTPTLLALRSDCRLMQANNTFVRESGYTEAELIGRRAGELELWADADAGQELERRLKLDGSVRDVTIQMRSRAGDLLDLLVSAEAVTSQGKSCVLMVAQNVSEHRRTEVEIASAIDAVMRDTSWFSDMVLEKLSKLRRPHALDGTLTSEISDLPPRGRDVLALVCRGMADKAVANKLGLSRNTVRNHVTALYRRTGVRNRTALVVWARERGFTGGPPPKSPVSSKS